MKEIGIAKVIADKRREKGMTQEELAAHMGVTKASVSKWETGLSYPDILFLPRLAAFFNLSIDELLCYTPQMTKEDIRKLYHEMSLSFTNQPFSEAKKKSKEVIDRYYSCYPLLVQMAILYINHHMLAESREEAVKTLEEAELLLERVAAESDDLTLAGDAVCMEACINQILGRPERIFELLGEEIKPRIETDSLMIAAYGMQGKSDQAKKLTQIKLYTGISESLGMLTGYLQYCGKEKERTEEIIRRACGIIELFNGKSVLANASAVFYFQAALAYMGLGEKEKALSMLTDYVSVCIQELRHATLHGDDFFDLLKPWFEECYLGSQLPRDQKSINEDMLAGLCHEAFDPLKEDAGYQELVLRMKEKIA